MTDSRSLEIRLREVEHRIARACEASGRDRSEVSLLAVSKGHSVDDILAAYRLGVRDFGESYVQEWLPKWDALNHLPDIRWHFIGHLQSNKAKFVAGKSHLIHSVDRLSVLEALEKSARNEGIVIDALVEVEIDPADANKGGVAQTDLAAFVSRLESGGVVRLKGFMGMGPANCSEGRLQQLYAQFVTVARDVFSGYRLGGSLPFLSLGMSDDLEVAIAAGSSMVRVGTAIFGEREYKR